MKAIVEKEDRLIDLETVNTLFLMNQLKRATDDLDLKAGADKILDKLINIANFAVKDDCVSIIEELKSMRLITDSSCSGSCGSCSSSSCG